jgi:hypothetical protein
MRVPARLGVLLALAVALTTWLVPAQAALASSCVSSAGTSPYTFTGKVDRVELDGRKAFVTTSNGREVIVLGFEASRNIEPRTYLAGETYEFHPTNDASPFRDNGCTATRAVGDQRWSGQGFLVLAIIAGMVLSAPSLARWIRRRAGPPPASPEQEGRTEPSA